MTIELNPAQATQDYTLQVSEQLKAKRLRIVFAESCTAGLLAATLGQVPGISESLCGSAVTYRNATKAGWLGVDTKLLDDPAITAVSDPVARQMARGVLQMTPEADLAVSVTGHLGPDAPAGQDGLVFVGIYGRFRQGQSEQDMIVHRIKLESSYPQQQERKVSLRVARQEALVQIIMKLLNSFLQQ